jgi:hypothetical protein
MFKELFYLIFSFSRRFDFVRTPALSSYLFVCLLIEFNIATVWFVLFHFLDISSANINIDTTFWGVIFGSIIMIINYFTLFSKRQIIFEKYSKQPKKRKIKGVILGATYIIFTFVVFYFVAKAFLPWW